MKNIKNRIRSLSIKWRAVIFFVTLLIFAVFITFPVLYQIELLIYKDDWDSTKGVWIQPLVILVHIPFMKFLIKWLNLDKKK